MQDKKIKLKLAIQKKGRLTKESIDFLRQCGLTFELSQRRLYSACSNFPLTIFYLRTNDIGRYVEKNIVDLGIVGQNILNEERPKVRKTLNLRFGFCSLILAVPKKSKIWNIKLLKGKTIATSYPNSTRKFFNNQKIPTKIIPLSGSVEIAPYLNVCNAIADLTSTGSTLALNDLKIIGKIYDSEAVLISTRDLPKEKLNLLNLLTDRFKSILSAKDYKNIFFSVYLNKLPKLKNLLADSKSLSILSDRRREKIVIQTIIKEDSFWQMLPRLERLGVSKITVLPVEKFIA